MEAIPDDEMPTTRSDVFKRATLATVLIVAAIAALAITSLVQSHERATAEFRHLERTAPKVRTLPPHRTSDSGEAGNFAYGHVEFDRDPAAPNGVPGFEARPPAGQP